MSMRVVVDNQRAVLRPATPADAPGLHALIGAHQHEGHLLPRDLGELSVHSPRFVVAVRGSRLLGCAELAPLSRDVAEVRSLVVDGQARGLGLALEMVERLSHRARLDGFDRLCAFAHDPRFFIRLGFSLVPHTWVPEKVAHDCSACPLFRSCGQQALILPLDALVARRARTIDARPDMVLPRAQ